MKITKYASQHCVKCKLLEKMLKHMNIENIETIYIENVDTEEFGTVTAFTSGKNKNTAKNKRICAYNFLFTNFDLLVKFNIKL